MPAEADESTTTLMPTTAAASTTIRINFDDVEPTEMINQHADRSPSKLHNFI